MVLLKLFTELFEQSLLFENIYSVCPLCRSEFTRNNGAVTLNFGLIEHETGSKKGWLQGLNLLLKLCELNTKIDHRLNHLKRVEQVDCG
jgi:hypothetical protein